MRAAHRPRVYVYELPTWLTDVSEHYVGWQAADPNYIAGEQFAAHLMRDWSVRTENPYEANLFFVPALNLDFTSNLGSPSLHTVRVLTYVRQRYPFWNRTNGRDHFVLFPGDRGACYLFPADGDFGDMIRVTHWGYSERDSKMFPEYPNHEYSCHKPGRDVVIPPFLYNFEDQARHTNWSAGGTPGRHKHLVFFAGGLRPGDPTYSGGARQELAQWAEKWAKEAGPPVTIHAGYLGNADYYENLRNSTFCLHAYGHGFGFRIVQIAVAGCVPLIIQDHVHQPLSGVLPYHRFALVVSKAEIPRLREMLLAVGPEEWARMRAAWRLAVPYFDWGPRGKAYEGTIESLWQSVQLSALGVSKKR